MYKLVLLLLLTHLLNASSPKIYAALGDKIYDNVEKINTLKNLDAFYHLKKEIEFYVQEVADTKEKGFTAQSTNQTDLKKSYLMQLRKLSKENDHYLRTTQHYYENSLKNRDNELFIGVVNSGLIDNAVHKQEILEYYYKYLNDIKISGSLESIVQEDKILKQKRNISAVNKKTKRMKEDEKIRRIRENDLEAQKSLEDKLQEEVNQKKVEIRNNQKEELKY